jgi:phosphoribosylglycinamide formyltransferase 2
MGTPLVGKTPRLLLLGSGELGREVAIEAMRLGAEVIAVDRYPHAPAMQIAHRHHVVTMTDPSALRDVVHREAPDLIVPEIEQVATAELIRLESEGYTVIPNAKATRITMDREQLRRLAVDEARVPTSRWAVVDSASEARRAAREIGVPCLLKSMMSSSGHGMTRVDSLEQVDAAYAEASQHGRVPDPRVMVEEFLRFDREVTMLTLRHYDPDGQISTTVLDPIAHQRPGTLYHESWQPERFGTEIEDQLASVAQRITGCLGGFGIFGVECFVAGGKVYFSEVSPRPHDTGLVTLGSQWNSEFALHARAILGLPYRGLEATTPAAAHVILGRESGRAPTFGGLRRAFAAPGVRLFFFGKPESYPDRRLGVAIARAETIDAARVLAASAAHAVESEITIEGPTQSP